ncbi:MAG TPA: bifunctional UDP-sugar hydrolase/5'-nucleotidase [Bacteroidales bacterium]|nr:bifunctional UDP-sugar hydrolase/5'-nucleotidase [Bacteroidales bacterium]
MARLIFLILLLHVTLFSNGQQGKEIKIIFTNDLHSRLAGYSPESAYSPLTINDDSTKGGFARIATIIRTEKEAGGTTVVVDAGDFLMGTLFQALEVENGFQLRLMKQMGYDAVAIGNHEFDYGPEKLAAIIGSATQNGSIPDVFLGNIEFDSRDTGDDALELLAEKNILKRSVIIEKDNLKLGIFSLLGKVADENAAFAKPVSFSGQVKAARKIVSELRQQGCDLVICLSHSGVTRYSDNTWGGEDVELAEKVKGIDVIISGHTHTRIDKPIIVKGIPIVQTGEYGQSVGKLLLTRYDDRTEVTGYELIPVDDRIQGDPLINSLIETQKELISEKVLKPAGMSYNTVAGEALFPFECNEQGNFKESNLGPVVADAIQYYVNAHSKEGTDISMVAVGVIRDRIVPGVQAVPDIFRVMSMGSGNNNLPGYPLARLYVTGKELKNVLEILQVAYRKAPENYCFYSGIDMIFDPRAGFMKKIKKIEITGKDGRRSVVGFSKGDTRLYSITANSYMLQFIGIIKKMSFGLINVVPKDAKGNKVQDMKDAVIDMDNTSPGIQEGREWLALYEFIRTMKDNDGDGIPEIMGSELK